MEHRKVIPLQSPSQRFFHRKALYEIWKCDKLERCRLFSQRPRAWHQTANPLVEISFWRQCGRPDSSSNDKLFFFSTIGMVGSLFAELSHATVVPDRRIFRNYVPFGKLQTGKQTQTPPPAKSFGPPLRPTIE